MEYAKGAFGILNIEDFENEPMVLLDGGIESRFDESYFFDNRKRPNYGGYLFQYTLSGSGIFKTDRESFLLAPGMAFLTAIPQNNCYYLPEKSEFPWEFLYLHFDGSAVFPFFKKLFDECGGLLSIDPQNSAIQKALSLQNKMISGGHLAPYEGGEFLYSFLCELLRGQLHPASTQKESIAGQAALFMDQNFATLSGIDEVAKRLQFSPEHLSRSFRSEWGMSPIHYLNRLRIQSAMNDLLSGTDTVETIAHQNGFANGNYFSKVFRRYTGMAPNEYRHKKTGQIHNLSV